MITKERLEELIEQGATIYDLSSPFEPFEIDFLKVKIHGFFKDGFNSYIECPTAYNGHQLIFCEYKDLYEFKNKEDAEWYLKYGKVTKTETISFPTYEKIMHDLEGKTGTYTIIDASNVLLEVNLGKYCIDQIYLYTNEDKFNWNLSKEGYEQACEMCVHEFKK
jgi:hypothetical protein